MFVTLYLYFPLRKGGHNKSSPNHDILTCDIWRKRSVGDHFWGVKINFWEHIAHMLGMNYNFCWHFWGLC